MFTKIQIAKEAATLATSAVAASLIARVVVNTTDVDEDSLALTVGSAVGGYIVSDRVRPQTDAAVEIAASKLSNLRHIRTPKVA